jgi:ketosteroid isomerase-like protein
MGRMSIEELAQTAWRGVADGDVEALTSAWDPKIVWHAAGSHPWAGRFEGIEVVLNHLAEIGESSDQFVAQLDELLTSDRRIVYFFRIHIRRGTLSADVDYVMSANHENGRMTYIWLAPLDPETLANLWE